MTDQIDDPRGSTEQMSKPHTRGCAKSLRELRALLAADLYRYAGKATFGAFVRHFVFTPGFKYTVWMRSTGYLRANKLGRVTLYPLFKWMLLGCRYKFGIAIPEYTVIGPGLMINRFGGVYVNGDAVIGKNCNITHGSVIGQSNRGRNRGAPILGDRVQLSTGCKVIGRVTIGNDAIIGANAVVTRDVPPMAVMGGVPARVLSMQGSASYINRQADTSAWDAANTEFGGINAGKAETSLAMKRAPARSA